jgi:hypothetical protein
MVLVELSSYLLPVIICAGISILITLLCNRSAAVLLTTIALCLALMVFQGLLDNVFYVFVSLFMGIGLWISIFGMGGQNE